MLIVLSTIRNQLSVVVSYNLDSSLRAASHQNRVEVNSKAFGYEGSEDLNSICNQWAIGLGFLIDTLADV